MMNSKHTIYIIPAVFAATALLLVVFGIYPLAAGIKSGSAKILSQRGRISTVQLQNRELEMFEERYKEYQPHLEATDALFVDAENPLDFITFLENIAAGTGVEIDVKLIPSKGKTIGVWPDLAFFISARGDFPHLAVFSEKLETGPYLIKIEKVSMQKNEESRGEPAKKFQGGVEASITLMIAAK